VDELSAKSTEVALYADTARVRCEAECLTDLKTSAMRKVLNNLLVNTLDVMRALSWEGDLAINIAPTVERERFLVSEKALLNARASKAEVSLAIGAGPCSFAFRVALKDHSVYTFGAMQQTAYLAATATALNNALFQVTIDSAQAGSVVVATKLVGLVKALSAAATTSPSTLATRLQAACLGNSAVSKPVIKTDLVALNQAAVH
jgi:hypothetical protein